MPGFDGTGPDGRGPRTGRGMGKCGTAQGRGQGRGRFGRFADQQDTMTPQEYLKALKESQKRIAEEIEALEKETR
jgi:hypothetical protein